MPYGLRVSDSIFKSICSRIRLPLKLARSPCTYRSHDWFENRLNVLFILVLPGTSFCRILILPYYAVILVYSLIKMLFCEKSQIQDPSWILLSILSPYGLFYNGWSHFGRQAAPAAASASETVQCGKGPADFTLPDPPGPPPARSFLTEMVLGGNQVPATTRPNPWPFLVSWFYFSIASISLKSFWRLSVWKSKRIWKIIFIFNVLQ